MNHNDPMTEAMADKAEVKWVAAKAPVQEDVTPDGHWIAFPYEPDDRPWKWPGACVYQGRVYKWTGFNSDTFRVYYKEWRAADLAFAVANVRPWKG